MKQVQVPGVWAKALNGNTEDTSVKDSAETGDDQYIQSLKTSSLVSNITYCYICGKPVKMYTSFKKFCLSTWESRKETLELAYNT